MGEIKINSRETDRLTGNINTGLQNLDTGAEKIKEAGNITSSAEGLTAYVQILSEMKQVMENYRRLLSMDTSRIEKSMEAVVQLDSRLESSFGRK